MSEKTMKPVPVIGKEYYFFDDGKTSPSRCYKAKVLQVLSYNDAKGLLVNKYDYDLEMFIQTSLHDIHKEEVNEHRNEWGPEAGKPWLYAEETDYFVECTIPGYDKHNLWFVRTINGGWFSMDIQSSWQAGRLDVDFTQYNDAKSYFDEREAGYYDKCLQEKGELI